MIQVFLTALSSATAAMLVAIAWILAVIGLLAVIVVLALVLGTAFDLATTGLSWFWRVTKHKPRSNLERILMGQKDGVRS